jgi:hypothetical protein
VVGYGSVRSSDGLNFGSDLSGLPLTEDLAGVPRRGIGLESGQRLPSSAESERESPRAAPSPGQVSSQRHRHLPHRKLFDGAQEPVLASSSDG